MNIPAGFEIEFQTDECIVLRKKADEDFGKSDLVEDLLHFFEMREGEHISDVDIEGMMDKAALRIEELERDNASLKNGIAFWNRVDHDKLEYFEGRIKELEGENAELKDKDDLYERDCRIEILSDALRRIRSYQDSDTVSSEEEALAEIFLICEECDV